jgi:hypothetical protein
VAGNPPAHFRPARSASRRHCQFCDFASQFSRHSLVGVYEQDPVCGDGLERRVALGGVIGKTALDEARPGTAGNLGGAVGAERVEDDDLVGPAQAGQAVGEVFFFVEGEDDGREQGVISNSPISNPPVIRELEN